MTDSTTGEPLAAVLLPNAINPDFGLPADSSLSHVTETDLTMEQAMSMLMTGGAVGPETIAYTSQMIAEDVNLPPGAVSSSL